MNGCARLRFLVLPCLLVLSYALAAEGAILLYDGSNVADAAAEATYLEELIIDPEGEVTIEWDINTTLPSVEETTESLVDGESQNDAATETPWDEGSENTTEALLEDVTTTAEPTAAESSSTEPATTEAESLASSTAGSAIESTTGSSVGPTTASSIDSTTGSTAGSSSDSSTGSSADSTTASAASESTADSTTAAAELSTAAPFVCEKPGTTPHPTDCHTYYSCQPLLGSTELITASVRCPEKMAFSADMARCSRDIATCSDDTFECLAEGTFAHPQTNGSYYRCMAGYEGFHKFHVECPLMKTYLPILGKCFIDINKLESLTQMVESELDDEIAVNAEIKLIKKAEKMRAKNEKLKEKMAMKLQKELDKKAAKEAKKQAKLALKNEAAVSVESAESAMSA